MDVDDDPFDLIDISENSYTKVNNNKRSDNITEPSSINGIHFDRSDFENIKEVNNSIIKKSLKRKCDLENNDERVTKKLTYYNMLYIIII